MSLSAKRYAWALKANSAHALLRTGCKSISWLAHHWLGTDAGTFDRIHHRSGYLFQDRGTSSVVEEDAYLLEGVR